MAAGAAVLRCAAMRRTLPLLPLLILAACDDGGGAIVDAATIDTPMNDCGCVADTPEPTVTVQVLDSAGPLAGVPETALTMSVSTVPGEVSHVR